MMADTMGKATKVWQAFVKFIKNQVTVNGRLVDTQLIGLFCKDSNGDVPTCPQKTSLRQASLNCSVARAVLSIDSI